MTASAISCVLIMQNLIDGPKSGKRIPAIADSRLSASAQNGTCLRPDERDLRPFP
jgi:hypothetical protein